MVCWDADSVEKHVFGLLWIYNELHHIGIRNPDKIRVTYPQPGQVLLDGCVKDIQREVSKVSSRSHSHTPKEFSCEW